MNMLMKRSSKKKCNAPDECGRARIFFSIIILVSMKQFMESKQWRRKANGFPILLPMHSLINNSGVSTNNISHQLLLTQSNSAYLLYKNQMVAQKINHSMCYINSSNICKFHRKNGATDFRWCANFFHLH